MANTTLPPTRILSWLQQVKEADPRWVQGMFRPWTYEFSSGRRFLWNPNVYTSTN